MSSVPSIPSSESNSFLLLLMSLRNFFLSLLFLNSTEESEKATRKSLKKAIRSKNSSTTTSSFDKLDDSENDHDVDTRIKTTKKIKESIGQFNTVHGLHNLGNTCYFNSVIQ
ncbi:hypothetical protein HMI54_006350, partial [Coelomomyces lativittatus]